MRNLKLPLVLLLLIAFSFTIIHPVTVYASPLSGSAPQISSDTGLGGSGIINILLGLLLGKFLGNSTGTGLSGLTSKVLGSSTDTGLSGLAKLLGTHETAPAQGATTGAAIIATAQKYLGTPYVWGGDTPSGGLDCSGFTQYVMQQNGMSIPRTAAEQFAVGTPVEKANLQAGDLIFFTTYKPGASHVGFYMGNGKFIHASSVAAKVTISSLDDQFYTEHYIGARSYLR